MKLTEYLMIWSINIAKRVYQMYKFKKLLFGQFKIHWEIDILVSSEMGKMPSNFAVSEFL